MSLGPDLDSGARSATFEPSTETTMTEDRHVSIRAHGETLAEATISPPDSDGEARVDVHTESGHLPAGARQRLADAIHEVVTDDHAERISATVPMGDAELVEGIRG